MKNFLLSINKPGTFGYNESGRHWLPPGTLMIWIEFSKTGWSRALFGSDIVEIPNFSFSNEDLKEEIEDF
jgi:hypothetical protein